MEIDYVIAYKNEVVKIKDKDDFKFEFEKNKNINEVITFYESNDNKNFVSISIYHYKDKYQIEVPFSINDKYYGDAIFEITNPSKVKDVVPGDYWASKGDGYQYLYSHYDPKSKKYGLANYLKSVLLQMFEESDLNDICKKVGNPMSIETINPNLKDYKNKLEVLKIYYGVSLKSIKRKLEEEVKNG